MAFFVFIIFFSYGTGHWLLMDTLFPAGKIIYEADNLMTCAL